MFLFIQGQKEKFIKIEIHKHIMKQTIDLVKYIKELKCSSINLLGSGSISLRLSNGLIAITPLGICYCDVNVNNISMITIDGELICGLAPSLDYELHLEIYKKNKEKNCIILN
jgi:L-fuculose-phosphate aldolase